MSLAYFHDIDDELVSYLNNRFHRWDNRLETIDGQQRVRIDLRDTEGSEEFIPAFFKFGNAQKKQEMVEEILSDKGGEVAPILLVEPLEPEFLDQQVPYSDYDTEYNEQEETVTLKKGKRRIRFRYQIEGVTRKWTDFQLLKGLLNHRLFEWDTTDRYFVNLFNDTFTVDMGNPQEIKEEESNLFRYIIIAGIEMNLYTLPLEVVESVESVIFNIEG